MINQQTNQKINESLAELQAIVDLYDPKKEYFIGAVALSLLAIFIIVILTVGVLWGLILCGIGLLPILYKALTSPTHVPTEKELSEKACILMSSCISCYKNPEMQIHCLSYDGNGKNASLYKEFVDLFPQMASKKLKKLASVNLGR